MADLIVDAVLGTGFKPPMKGMALVALEWLRKSQAPVLAVDLPSGWPADETGATVSGAVFPADAVITFTAPKPAHVFGQLTRRWDQPIVVAPIGSPDAAIVSRLGIDWAGSSLALAQTPRAAAANKGNFGHVLVVGGTFGSAGGKAGAPVDDCPGCIARGAGLVTAAVPEPALPVVSSFAAELMTWPLEATMPAKSPRKTSSRMDFLSSPREKPCSPSAPVWAKCGNGEIHHGIALRDQNARRDRCRRSQHPGHEAGVAG